MESLALRVWSVNHWTTKQVHPFSFILCSPSCPSGGKTWNKQTYTNQLLDLITRGNQEDFPRGLMQGVWVQSLVGELRSHMPLSQKKKKTPKQNRSNIVTNSIKSFKMVHMGGKKKKQQPSKWGGNEEGKGSWKQRRGCLVTAGEAREHCVSYLHLTHPSSSFSSLWSQNFEKSELQKFLTFINSASVSLQLGKWGQLEKQRHRKEKQLATVTQQVSGSVGTGVLSLLNPGQWNALYFHLYYMIFLPVVSSSSPWFPPTRFGMTSKDSQSALPSPIPQTPPLSECRVQWNRGRRENWH